jgi:hypothetical protein
MLEEIRNNREKDHRARGKAFERLLRDLKADAHAEALKTKTASDGADH